MIWDTTTQYTYDAEGRVQTVANVNGTNATYTYDSNGQRIRKDIGANWTEYLYFGGAVLSEITSSGTTDYIYNNGQMYARATSASPTDTFYYHQDHLGTTSLITDSSGNLVSNCTYAPFGQPLNCTADDPNNHYRFTGDEYDAESETQHTQFRQLASRQGRWLSPDPYLGSIDLGIPQSINRYAYVLNNPLSFVDPDGRDCYIPSEGGVIESDSEIAGPMGDPQQACIDAEGFYITPGSGYNVNANTDPVPIGPSSFPIDNVPPLEGGNDGTGSGNAGASSKSDAAPTPPPTEAPNNGHLDKKSCASRLAAGVQETGETGDRRDVYQS